MLPTLHEELIASNISRYSSLSTAEMAYFMTLLETRSIRKKEYLLRAGEVCRYDYFITKGCVKVCFTDEKENERIMKFATENSWVIDLESFLNNKPSSFYIQAIEDTEYFRLSQSSYRLLYKVVPQFEKFSIEHWRNGFIALHQRIMQNLSMSAEERYQLFKNKYPGLEQRIPQKLVASYLGVTPEFIGKLRRKYTAQLS